MDNTIKIAEIFYSLQGESTSQGLPCTFVRLAGCNLRCSYCDTPYAQEGGKELSVEEVLSKLSSYPTKLVEITGGEPLLQKRVYELIQRLLDKKYEVLVETNGSVDIGNLPSPVKIIMDLKCPSSGMSEKIDWANLGKLKEKDEIKFVLQDAKDYSWAKEIIEKYNLQGRELIFSPVVEKLSLQKLAQWILKDGLLVRLQLQLHKLIWPEGVGR